MFLSHPRCEVDAIDTTKTRLKIRPAVREGFKAAGFRTSARVFAADRLPPRAYVRDSNTGQGICTPAVRKTVGAFGRPGWMFASCFRPGASSVNTVPSAVANRGAGGQPSSSDVTANRRDAPGCDGPRYMRAV